MEISLASLKKIFGRFLGRFHIVIFAVVILGGLSVVILLLHSIITTSNDPSGYTPNGISSSFDNATINRIEQLKTRTEGSGDLNLPPGRTNPFVE